MKNLSLLTNCGSVLCLPGELQLIRKLKVYETTQAPSQFIKTTKLPAVPFTCIGKICNMKTSIN